MNNLKALRERRQVSQQAVADYLQITRQAYGNYETGNREPDVDTLMKLSAYFAVSIDGLLRGAVPNAHDTRSSSPRDDRLVAIDNIDLRTIARAGTKLKPEDATQLLKYAEFMFPEAFGDDQ